MTTPEEWAYAFDHAPGCHHAPVYLDSTKAPDYPPEYLTED